MDNDSLPTTRRWNFGEIRKLTRKWEGLGLTSLVAIATSPYVLLVQRLEKGISWRDRIHILLTGQLPDEF
jgi:hypothetical protein